MTKREAVELLVQRDFQAIPTEWVTHMCEMTGQCRRLPMWGTMFLVDEHIGERLDVHGREVTEAEDEEMAGERRIADTAAFLYNVAGSWVIGVNGAGWDFYNGVWDEVYDLLGLAWHEAEESPPIPVRARAA